MAISDIISTPLLDGLSPADRSRLSDLFTRRVYPAGTTIMRQGEHCSTFFLIESGSVVARSSERGVLAIRGPGETLGEIAMFTGEPASATLTTETDAVILAAPRAELRALVEESPILACNLCRLLGRRLAAAGQ